MLFPRRPCSNSSGPYDEQHHHRDRAADGAGQQASEQEDVDEGDRAEDRVPEPQTELVVRQQAEPESVRTTIQNFSGGFSRKTLLVSGLSRGFSQSPFARISSTANEYIASSFCRSVRPRPMKSGMQKAARTRTSHSGRTQSFTHVTSDQIRGTFTFSIETGCRSACARNAGRSRSALKPMWIVIRRDHPFAAREDRVRTEEVVQEDDPSTGTADAAHLARDLDRIGHDADQVRGVDDVERVVGELEIGGVHLEEPHVAQLLAGGALARLLEHRRREVDAGDGAVAWDRATG